MLEALAVNRIKEEVDEDANIIFGTCTDEDLHGRIRVSLVATGIERPNEVPIAEPPNIPPPEPETVVDVPNIPDLSDIFHEEEPVETEPDLLQTDTFFGKKEEVILPSQRKEEVILPSQQKNDLAVEMTETRSSKLIFAMSSVELNSVSKASAVAPKLSERILS